MNERKEISYVVITPAFNEEGFIRDTIESMIQQTVLPEKWIIVDDESSDATAQIIRSYTKDYEWIEYCYNKKKLGETYYSSNVFAILHGMKMVKNIQYSYLAILDADIELCNNYYEKIFAKFDKYENLGVATGVYLEREGEKWIEARIDRRSTPKSIQVFRRECYEATLGYLPFKYGGEDTGMEIMARMNGWGTWSFVDIMVKHKRPVGTGNGSSLLRARFRLGITDYCLGTHPLFMLFKVMKRMFWEKPFVFSGLMRLLGYAVSGLRRLDRPLPPVVIKFVRDEQLERLFKFDKKRLSYK